MEMGRCVVGKIHKNDNSVKKTDLWHDFYFDCKYTNILSTNDFLVLLHYK